MQHLGWVRRCVMALSTENSARFQCYLGRKRVFVWLYHIAGAAPVCGTLGFALACWMQLSPIGCSRFYRAADMVV